MSRSVLVVEPDLDALGELASKLRSRGLNVALADSGEGLIDRMRGLSPDAVLLSSALPDAGDLALRVIGDRSLHETRCFLLVREAPTAPLPVDHLRYDQMDEIVRQVYALPSRPPPTVVEREEIRGELARLSVPDLLQLLSMNRRTGTLSVVVASGAGEVRLIDGEVVDAVFRQLEAEKALYRLLAESDGSFTFASGLPVPVRRIATSTTALLMEGMRVVDEVRRRRTQLGADGDALLATATPEGEVGSLLRRVLTTLLAPHTVDELIDALPEADHEILGALESLLADGRVRRIPKGAVRVQLGRPEQLTVLGALASRLRPRGYVGPARIVIAIQPQGLAPLAHALRRIAEAHPPAEPAPNLPLPHLLVRFRLGDGAELDLVGLPLDSAYAPTWGLALGGSAVAVRVGEIPSAVLEEACAVAGVPLFDAEVLLGAVDVADPVQMAALVRATLDAMSGG